MPKWLIGLVIAGTTFTLLASFAAWRVLSAERSADTPEIERTESPSGSVYAPTVAGNTMSFTTDPETGRRVFRPRPGMEGFSIPEFAMIDQDGRPADESVLDGQVTVLAFMFTHCELACPPITANMRRLYSHLEETNVRFLSISVDPVNDTPEVLRAYAENLGVDTQRWRFLTGPEGEAGRVIAESLKFDVSEDPDDANIIELPDGSTMRNIRHPTRLFLIGPDRRILDFCSPTVDRDRERFAALARMAAG